MTTTNEVTTETAILDDNSDRMVWYWVACPDCGEGLGDSDAGCDTCNHLTSETLRQFEIRDRVEMDKSGKVFVVVEVWLDGVRQNFNRYEVTKGI